MSRDEHTASPYFSVVAFSGKISGSKEEVIDYIGTRRDVKHIVTVTNYGIFPASFSCQAILVPDTGRYYVRFESSAAGDSEIQWSKEITLGPREKSTKTCRFQDVLICGKGFVGQNIEQRIKATYKIETKDNEEIHVGTLFVNVYS